jgi:hypothetical protein
MAIIQYSNGLVEDFKAKNLVLAESEILNYFKDFQRVRTKRLIEIPNSWCVWGASDVIDSNAFNQLGSRISGEKIFSPLIIIHDSELDPDWLITDKIILKTYPEFRQDFLSFADNLASEIINQNINQKSEGGAFGGMAVMPSLSIMGPTEDKRILFDFNPENQAPEFWKFENFSFFASRVFGYIHVFFDRNLNVEENSFVIYADVKVIIIIRDQFVKPVLEKMIKNFEKREKYHGCSHMIAMIKKWDDYVNNQKKPIDKKWGDYLQKKNGEE